MKSTVEKVSNLQRKLNIEVPGEIVQSTFEKYYKGIQKDAHLKGFRKGRAPIDKIRAMYVDRVKQDVAQELIQRAYIEALREHSLVPISYPDIEYDNVTESGNFSFSATFDLRPEVNLKKFEGLDVLKEKLEFDEGKVDAVLENIRHSRAQLVPVLFDRPVQKGDVAVIDFEGSMNGAPLENGAGTDHHLEIGANQFIPGFEDGVEGMSIGQTKVISLKFPEPYHAAELAGQPVDFKVVLKGLKKRDLPELNEEFIKSLGGPGTLEDLRKTIREDLEQTENRRIEQDFKNRLLKALVESNPVEVPPSLMQEQKNSLIEDFRNRMTEKGMTEDEFQDYVKKWDGDFDKSAREMIQANFLVEALAEKNGLKATDADFEKRIHEYAAETNIELSRVKEFYHREDQKNRLIYLITEENVVDFLTKSARVTEVNKSQLTEN